MLQNGQGFDCVVVDNTLTPLFQNQKFLPLRNECLLWNHKPQKLQLMPVTATVTTSLPFKSGLLVWTLPSPAKVVLMMCDDKCLWVKLILLVWDHQSFATNLVETEWNLKFVWVKLAVLKQRHEPLQFKSVFIVHNQKPPWAMLVFLVRNYKSLPLKPRSWNHKALWAKLVFMAWNHKALQFKIVFVVWNHKLLHLTQYLL